MHFPDQGSRQWCQIKLHRRRIDLIAATALRHWRRTAEQDHGQCGPQGAWDDEAVGAPAPVN